MGKQKGVKCVRGLIPHSECRKCANEPLHPCAYTPQLLESLREQNQELRPDEFTPTRLIDCPRKAQLQLSQDWYLDVDRAWPALRGTIMHARLETLPKGPGMLGEVREVRLQTTIQTRYGPQIVKGKSDLIVVLDVEDSEVALQVVEERVEGNQPVMRIKVVDYKSKGQVEHDLTKADSRHIIQINLYGWLAARALPVSLGRPELRVEVAELEIMYVGANKPRRFTSAGPLKADGKFIDRRAGTHEELTLEAIPIRPLDKIEEWVIRRVETVIEAREFLPPPLTGKEAEICQWCPVRQQCEELAREGV